MSNKKKIIELDHGIDDVVYFTFNGGATCGKIKNINANIDGTGDETVTLQIEIITGPGAKSICNMDAGLVYDDIDLFFEASKEKFIDTLKQKGIKTKNDENNSAGEE